VWLVVGGKAGRAAARVGPGDDAQQAPLSRLRGAAVEADARRVGAVVSWLCVAALTSLVVALFVAGADKNSEITQLRRQGVPVEVTVSSCLGLMGGSGSNVAGYSCKGSFTHDGHRYRTQLPGTALHPRGFKLRAVAVVDDPGLVSTPAAVASEHPSTTVFILPGLLSLVLALAVGILVRKTPRLWASSGKSPVALN